MSTYLRRIHKLKNSPSFVINVKKYGKKHIRLRVVTSADLDNKKLIRKLSDWRDKNSFWFPAQFKVTSKRTRKWLKDFVLDKPDRILFVIEDFSHNLYGHLGFYRWRKRDNSCELDNVVRGVDAFPGLMTDCVNVIIDWGFKNLKIDHLFLTTFDDNVKAVNLYKRCNFKKTRKIPLKHVNHNGELHWEIISTKEKLNPQRYYLRMKYVRPSSH